MHVSSYTSDHKAYKAYSSISINANLLEKSYNKLPDVQHLDMMEKVSFSNWVRVRMTTAALVVKERLAASGFFGVKFLAGAALPFSQFSAAVVRHKANDGVI